MIGNRYSQNYNEQLEALNNSYSSKSITQDVYEKDVLIIEKKMAVEKIEYSAAGRIGHFIEPVFKPLGFDWRLSLASVTGIAGKEVVVSTIGTLFSIVKTQNNNAELNSMIAESYSPLTGFNFMLFTLLYFPCIASLAVFKKEAGIKEMIFQICFYSVSCLDSCINCKSDRKVIYLELCLCNRNNIDCIDCCRCSDIFFQAFEEGA